jgi:hypothetical protein
VGLFDKLKGIHHPDDETPVQTRHQLEQRLRGLDGDQVPFTVSDGSDSDLDVHWKIVDAQWYEIFAKAGLKKAHSILLVLDESDHEVRALDEEWTVEWRAGVPSLSISAEKFRGRTLMSVESGKGWAFKGVNPLDWGEVYDYHFNVSEMKDPLVAATTAAGWSYVPVTTKRGLRG